MSDCPMTSGWGCVGNFSVSDSLNGWPTQKPTAEGVGKEYCPCRHRRHCFNIARNIILSQPPTAVALCGH